MFNNEKRLINTASKFSFICFIVSQIFLPNTIFNQFSIILLCSTIVILMITEKKIHYQAFFLFSVFFIAYNYLIIYSGSSINDNNSLDMLSTLIFNLVIGFFVFNYIVIRNKLEESLNIFYKTILIYTFTIFAFSLSSIFSGRLGSDVVFRLPGIEVTHNSNMIAMLAGFSFLICIYNFFIKRNSLLLLSASWFVLIILLSGSRKGILLILLGLTLLVLIYKPKKSIRNMFIVIFSSILIYIAIIFIPFLYDIVGHRMEALINMFLGEEVEEASANTRELFVERGWQYFLDSIWFGYGLDNFRFLEGSYGTYSHNNYIELLISGGIPALFLYYFVRIVILIQLFMNRKHSDINKLLFVFVLVLIILEYGLVTYFERTFMLVYIFAICGYIKRKKFTLADG